jgi:hypothetical protein
VHERVNIVEILHTHICKCKNDTVETIQEWRDKGIKENDGGCKFKYDIFDIM